VGGGHGLTRTGLQYPIKAPSDGQLEAVLYKEGDMVADGAALVKFTAAA
jgi:biotin carboxyl carrier protein